MGLELRAEQYFGLTHHSFKGEFSVQVLVTRRDAANTELQASVGCTCGPRRGAGDVF